MHSIHPVLAQQKFAAIANFLWRMSSAQARAKRSVQGQRSAHAISAYRRSNYRNVLDWCRVRAVNNHRGMERSAPQGMRTGSVDGSHAAARTCASCRAAPAPAPLQRTELPCPATGAPAQPNRIPWQWGGYPPGRGGSTPPVFRTEKKMRAGDGGQRSARGGGGKGLATPITAPMR